MDLRSRDSIVNSCLTRHSTQHKTATVEMSLKLLVFTSGIWHEI